MGRDDENFNQNPCSDSLKSLLKKPGAKGKTSNRVVFNENKNEFFDADYIILIREECEYEDEDEEEVCTCDAVVSRVCCEPNCGCGVYDLHEQTPQSPKFAPPIEFVDTVTLSPPEGYKDMELDDKQIIAIQELSPSSPKAAVCRECIASQKEAEQDAQEIELIDKQNEFEELEDDGNFHLITSPVSGILKGGLLWKHHGCNLINDNETTQIRKQKVAPDKESASQRAVRFIENGEDPYICNREEKENYLQLEKKESNDTSKLSSQETTEMLLTFKFGNHVLISNNSLKPNSAVRQLFPNAKSKEFENESPQQFLVNADALRTFDEAKVSKFPQIIERYDKRTIEHGTFRRSFIRYEPKTKRAMKKDDNSLVERIKLLTCDLDGNNEELHDISDRISPTGEESHDIQEVSHPKLYVKNSSPSSSSTTSSNSSSISSTYKKITDLFVKKEKNVDMNIVNEDNHTLAPDLGGPQIHNLNKCQTKANAPVDNKRQLLSTLVPLTACVNVSNSNEYYYNVNNDFANRTVSSSTNTEYLTENTNEDVAVNTDESKLNTPDVLAGTPSTTESIDDLSAFVQQDVCGVDRTESKCHSEDQLKKEDDENDDYGFNRRPSVQGVKQKFGASTEVLHQIQNHLEGSDPNVKLTWPYYSESSFTENNQNISKIVPEGVNPRVFSPQYPFKDDNSYQNYYNKKIMRGPYNTNLDTHSEVIGIEVDYNEYYLPQRNRSNRPLSPPPQDFSRNYHTMVYIPYNHIEGCRPFVSPNQYHQPNDIMKLNNLNPQNKMYDEQYYQQKMHQTEIPNPSNMLPVLAQRPANMYLRSNQIHLSTCSTNEAALVAQTSVKSTQTLSSPLLACSYFHNIKCKSVSPIWKNFGNCNTKNNRHSFPSNKPRFPTKSEDVVLQESNFNYNRQISNESKDYVDLNNYLSPNSSAKLKFMERGVPEGAASVPPVVSTNNRPDNGGNMAASPSSSHFKSFYAMNV